MMPRTVFAVSCAAMTVVALSINLVPVCLPLFREGFGSAPLNDEQLGRIAAMIFIGLVSGVLVAGPLANRHHPRWFTAGGSFAVGVGLLIVAWTRSYQGLLFAACLMGLGGGVLDMILSPVVCALTPEARTKTLNWLHSFYCVGAVLTVLVATVTLAWGIGWRTVAVVMTAPAFLVGIVFLILPHPQLLAEPRSRARVRDLIHERFFRYAMITIFLGGAAEMAVSQWLPAFAELELGFSRNVGGSSLLVFSVAMVLGRWMVVALHHRYSIYTLMFWSTATTTIALLVAGLVPSPWISLSAAVLSGFTGSCLWPSTLGVAADRYPQSGASMFALLSALGNFGGIIMPWGVGVIADKSSIALGIAFSALCPLFMLGSLRAMRSDERAAAAAPATVPITL